MSIHSKILVCLLAIAGTCFAQNQNVNVTLSALALDGRIRDLKYESNGSVEALYAFKDQRSETFKYSGPKKLVFFRELEQFDENGAPKRQPVAECMLPGSSGQYLLIISEDRGAGERYRIFPIADDWATFRPGTYRFMNLTPFEMALKLDDKVYQIGSKSLKDVSGNFENNSHQRAIMVSLPPEQDPLRVFEGYIQYTDDRRMLYLITPKEGGRLGRVRFTAIPEAIPQSENGN